ncbi:MAG: DUF805 domain-containing protein [Sphingomicrobium sp.]|nr:DUF805 domain-containing protein [Sphingomonadales bacterium]
MTVFEQAVQPLRKYADFAGRASRGEFWTFFFVVLLLQTLARLVDAVMGRGGYLPGPVASLAALLLFVPQAAVAVRRLHDINRSGRELLVPCVMLLCLPLMLIFGGLLGRIVALGYYGVMLLLFAQLLLMLNRKGSSIPNRYGPAPTAFTFAG